MSTGLNCEILEPTPGEWFYILEHYNAPKNAWDWHDHATAYGPFPSQAAADRHLSDNHANPGGCYVLPYQHPMKLAVNTQALLEKARTRKEPRSIYANFGIFRRR